MTNVAAASELLKPYDARTMRCNALAFPTPLYLNTSPVSERSTRPERLRCLPGRRLP